MAAHHSSPNWLVARSLSAVLILTGIANGGSLFVTFAGAPVKRLDPQTFEILGSIPGSGGMDVLPNHE